MNVKSTSLWNFPGFRADSSPNPSAQAPVAAFCILIS